MEDLVELERQFCVEVKASLRASNGDKALWAYGGI